MRFRRGAGVICQTEFRQSAPRDTLVEAPSARRSDVYARLSAFRRRSTRDASRRRASPASACVAFPDAKTAKKPDTSAERNARTTVRKAVAVTTKREGAHRLPRGVAGWCHRLLDHCDILILHDLTASSKGVWLSGCIRLPSNFPAGVGQVRNLFRIGKVRAFTNSRI